MQIDLLSVVKTHDTTDPLASVFIAASAIASQKCKSKSCGKKSFLEA